MNFLFITWFFSISAVIGSILNVKKIGLCFFVWTACNIFWLIYDLINHEYARSALDFVNLATSSWGMVEWSKDKSKKK